MSTKANRILMAALALAGLLAPAAAGAQTPLPPNQPVDWQKVRENQLRTDWPYLARYAEANRAVAPPQAGEPRVVFIGDSVFEHWGLAQSFPAKPYFNRAISGQTTPQMLLRFRQDVVALKPRVVVILGGTNDLVSRTGPETLEEIEDNFASMADLAAANHIGVVLCSILPVFEIPGSHGNRPGPKIAVLNEFLRDLAARKGYVFVDVHTPMRDDRDGLPPALSQDGVHPLPAGYALMAPLVEAGIEKAMQQGEGSRGWR